MKQNGLIMNQPSPCLSENNFKVEDTNVQLTFFVMLKALKPFVPFLHKISAQKFQHEEPPDECS